MSYTGSFSSPNYPWYYPNNADCRFQIKVPARRHTIALNIFNFDTEAGYDFLKVSLCCAKKSLKIPKGKSESANRRTDNTMTKRKRTNNDLQNILFFRVSSRHVHLFHIQSIH